MTRGEALAMLAALVAGFPHDALEEPTTALYLNELESFTDVRAMQLAVRGLIRSEHKLPVLATIIEAYRREHRRLLEEAAHAERARQLDLVAAPMPAEVRDWVRAHGW